MTTPKTSSVPLSTTHSSTTTPVVTPSPQSTTTGAVPSIRTTRVKSTTTVSQPTPKPARPTSCYLCNGPPFICESRYLAHQCQSADQQFCVTTIHNNDDGTRSVFRSCATETGCRDAHGLSDDRRCLNYKPSVLYLDDFRCSWCCNTPLSSQMCVRCTGTTCNGKLSPSHCPLGKDYCMSSIIDSDNGSRNQTRSCVTEGECYRRWIGNTLTSPECMSLIVSGSGPSGQNLTCDYCCTSSGCNSVQFPPASTLYHKI